MSAFWVSEPASKLDHIAVHGRQWAEMGIIWMGMVAVASAGIAGLVVLLSQEGEALLGSIALALFFGGVVGMLVTAFILFGVGGFAGQSISGSGSVPGWLGPMWAVANWAEVSYIILTSLAYVVLGVAMVRSAFPATWAAVASLIVGAASVIGMAVAPARFGFPQLPMIVPVVLGSALLLA